MSKIKDPDDYIELDSDPNHQMLIALDFEEKKKPRRKRSGRMRESWIGYIYDLIVFFTLVAVVATLVKILLS